MRLSTSLLPSCLIGGCQLPGLGWKFMEGLGEAICCAKDAAADQGVKDLYPMSRSLVYVYK